MKTYMVVYTQASFFAQNSETRKCSADKEIDL